MRPLIGIPPCLDAQGRWKKGRTYQYVDVAYASAVADAGGLPVHLALGAEADAVVARLAGLLVPGGDDLPPPLPYPASVRFESAPAAQLAFDSAVIDAALSRGLPVLGICYGMQLLAARSGGSLHHDLPSDVPEAAAHQLDGPGARHRIAITSGSRLASILDALSADVNSRHHQAVATPGPRLRACAHSDDGVIEAIESPADCFVLGVQWHPETLEAEHRERLFGAFVRACSDT